MLHYESMDIQTEIHIVVYQGICECFYSYHEGNIAYDPIASSKHKHVQVDMWGMVSYNVWSPITDSMKDYEY
jgi:UDP-galactopyranose mutase